MHTDLSGVAVAHERGPIHGSVERLPAFARARPNPHFTEKVFSNERLKIVVGRFV